MILCAFILALTAPTAKASNAYISDVSFYKNGDGIVIFKFYVNTTFSINIGEQIDYEDNLSMCAIADTYFFGKSYDPLETGYGFDFVSPTNWENYLFETCNRVETYTAGNTYETIVQPGNIRAVFNRTNRKMCVSGNNCGVATSKDFVPVLGEPTSATYFTEFGYQGYPAIWPFQDNEKYYYAEYPALNIDYPLNNAEISGAFYITGLYTLPSGSGLDTLLAMVNEPGIYDATYYGFFQTDLQIPGGFVNIRVAGVPAGEYEIFFAFMNYDDPDDIYISPVSIPITIVVGSPSEFEPGEIPPPIFNIFDPDEYYDANSNYASSTLVFDNLSGAVKPVILKIGDYLTFFSSKFDIEIAKETGEEMASGVLIVRAYADNLNTFFGDLPISQALFFYLLLLVVVAVFRIVRNLINLIKP